MWQSKATTTNQAHATLFRSIGRELVLPSIQGYESQKLYMVVLFDMTSKVHDTCSFPTLDILRDWLTCCLIGTVTNISHQRLMVDSNKNDLQAWSTCLMTIHGIYIKEIVNIVCRAKPLRAWQPIRIVKIDESGACYWGANSSFCCCRRLGVGSNTSHCKGQGVDSGGRCWLCPDNILLPLALWLEIFIFIIRNWSQGRNRLFSCIHHSHEIFSWRLCCMFCSTTLTMSCGYD